MKIVFLTPWYPDKRQPFLGLFIREQARALAKKQHKVIVIVAKVDYSRFAFSKYSVTEKRDWENLTEYQLTIFRSLPFFNQLNHLFISWKVSRQVLLDKQVDVIHSFIGYPGAIWGWMMSVSLNIPFIHTEHTKLSNNYRSLWHKVLTHYGMRKARQLTTVSHWLAKQLENVVGKNVRIIPNLIDTSRFTLQNKEKPAVIQMGFLGGLQTPVKGLDILLHAVAKCPHDFLLHIGGEGALKEEYVRLSQSLGISEKCRFYGSIPVADVPSFYQRLHFFICASRHETFSIATVEALASGIPVVATKCGGPEEIVVDQTLGLLVENQDSDALGKGIQQMIHTWHSFNPERLHSYVQERYSIEAVVTLYEKVYSEFKIR